MRLLATGLLIFLNFLAFSQEKILPDEAKPFVVSGYEMLDYIAGDLNGDKKQDAILILKHPLEDSVMDDEKPRPMLLLIRQANGKLKQAARNDKAILCRHCGGVFGDPYEGISITGKSFEISFYGGSNWRWAYHYSFNYDPALKNWFLHKEHTVTMNTGDPEGTTQESTIPRSELGNISFDKFSSQNEYAASKWKVIAPKAYFYDSPLLTSKPRKGYMVKGNLADGMRQLKNFIEVTFENSKGEFTHGYILRKDLQAVK